MKTIKRWLLFLSVILLISWVFFRREYWTQDVLWHGLQEAGWGAPLLFVLLYVIATVAFAPGALLTLLAGAWFGPWCGAFYSLTGATLGAGVAFLIARYLAADWVEKTAHGRLAQLKSGIEAEGWRFVAFVRLVPLFPFNLLNYALGLTQISFRQYLLSSYVFMLPGALAYSWLGYAGKQALEGDAQWIEQLLVALALLAAVAFIPRFIHSLRKQGQSQ